MSELVLDVAGLTKRFQLHERGCWVPGPEGVCLQVRAGELTALTGPSGAGKSSILKCVWRTYRPTDGSMRFQPRGGPPIDLARAADHEVLALRRGELGFVTQFLQCLPRQATVDVVAQPLVESGVDPVRAQARARDVLAALGLPERLWSISPYTFSGGEKQRVNLARGLVRPPRLLLLDEPTASLDHASRERAVALIEALKRGGAGVLAIFHDDALAARLAERRVALHAPAPEEHAA